MTTEANGNQENVAKTETAKPNDKEYNFRALEAKYERQLAQERSEREKVLKELEAARQSGNQKDEDEDAEPYVDHKRLQKKLDHFGKNTKTEISQAMEEAKRKAKEELKQELWLESNADFYDVMQKHAERFFEKAPQLAETILKMPEGFERSKLVYHNIKTLGLDRPEQKQSSIQEKIDANRRSPFYQPTGIANTPYAQGGDFSDAGKKNAYEQMQKLKSNLRLG